MRKKVKEIFAFVGKAFSSRLLGRDAERAGGLSRSFPLYPVTYSIYGDRQRRDDNVTTRRVHVYVHVSGTTHRDIHIHSCQI